MTSGVRDIHDALLKAANQNAVTDRLKDADTRALLLKRHGAYLAFHGAWLGADQPLPWWQRRFDDLHGQRLHIAGLDSAWLSWQNDDARLLLGTWQINQTARHAVAGHDGDFDWRIALLHHPWASLAEFDRIPAEATLHRHRDLILRGHLHQPHVVQTIPIDEHQQCIEAAAGCCYSGSGYPNAFHWIELFQHPRRVRFHFRYWNDTDWDVDMNKARNAQGVYTIEVPGGRIPTGPGAGPTQPAPPPKPFQPQEASLVMIASSDAVDAAAAPRAAQTPDAPPPIVSPARRDLCFLSYAHADDEAHRLVRAALHNELQPKGLSLWDDLAIRAGERWDPAIESAISRAAVAVVILSENLFERRETGERYLLRKELPLLLAAYEARELDLLLVYWSPSVHYRSQPPAQAFSYEFGGVRRSFDFRTVQIAGGPRPLCFADAQTRCDTLQGIAYQAGERLAARVAGPPAARDQTPARTPVPAGLAPFPEALRAIEQALGEAPPLCAALAAALQLPADAKPPAVAERLTDPAAVREAAFVAQYQAAQRLAATRQADAKAADRLREQARNLLGWIAVLTVTDGHQRKDAEGILARWRQGRLFELPWGRNACTEIITARWHNTRAEFGTGPADADCGPDDLSAPAQPEPGPNVAELGGADPLEQVFIRVYQYFRRDWPTLALTPSQKAELKQQVAQYQQHGGGRLRWVIDAHDRDSPYAADGAVQQVQEELPDLYLIRVDSGRTDDPGVFVLAPAALGAWVRNILAAIEKIA